MMEREAAIERLHNLIDEGRMPEVQVDGPTHTRWRANAEAVLKRALPPDSSTLAKFVAKIYHLLHTSNGPQGRIQQAEYFRNATEDAVALLQSAIFEVQLLEDDKVDDLKNAGSDKLTVGIENDVDSGVVFLVYGRNISAKNAMFQFLASIGLSPVEWDEAINWTGSGTPYVGDIIDAALARAQAVVVLMTPDEVTYLDKAFSNSAADIETEPAAQVRPNVLFEAGMAMGRKPKHTVLVQLGEMRGFSDIHGRHVIRLTNETEMRRSLAMRLFTVGCKIDLSGEEWKIVGDFSAPSPPGVGVPIVHGISVVHEPGVVKLDAKYLSKSDSGYDLLQVTNLGSEDVLNLTIQVPDFPGLHFIMDELPLERLPAGRRFHIRVIRTMGESRDQFEITINGSTSTGKIVSEKIFVDTFE